MDRIACASSVAALVIVGSVHAMPIRGYLNIRTVSVDNLGPPAPDPGIASDIAYQSQIYRQIGITVNHSSNVAIVQVDPDASGVWTPAEVTAALLNQARGQADELPMYFVRNFNGGSPVAQAWSNEDVGANVGAVTNPARNNDTIAHESGHVLLDRWRWRFGEGSAANGIHSSNPNDLMATSAAPVNRNVPANLQQVAPFGNFDRIGFNVGPLSNDANRAQPQISAMWFNSGLVNITQRDTVNLEVGPSNGPRTSTGNIPWAQKTTISELGANITIDTAARQSGNNNEDYTLYFRADTPLAGLAAGERTAFILNDLDSVDVPFVNNIVGNALQIRTFANSVDPAGGGNGTLLADGTDYTWSSVFDNMTKKVNVRVNINNERLNAMRDVWVTFSNQVPAPGSAGLLALALIASRRRRA